MDRTSNSLIAVVLSVSLFACTGTRPDNLGVQPDGTLAPCPSTPNCVSSYADRSDEQHFIQPLTIVDSVDAAWSAARGALLALPRTKITVEEDNYLRAESTSRIFRFVDDVELHLRPRDGIIAVRSASRLGRSDLGVNRKRVEQIRTNYRERLPAP